MKVYGQLEYADLHNLSADPSAGKVGRIYWNTTSSKTMFDDGTNIYALLRNDGKIILGNNATAANNVRLHRGAAGLIQFLAANDTTAEGTLSTALAAISAKLESYAFASLPAAGNAGRRIWVTDRSSIYVDTGSVWKPASTLENFTNSALPTPATAGRIAWVTDKSVVKVDTGAAWIAVGTSGGSSTLQWVEGVDSPDPQLDSGARIYVFGAGLSQFLTAIVRIPNSYVSGSQIRLRALAYSSDTTGTMLLNTVSTLIRTGTDAISSTTNQRTSTNTAAALSAGTASIPQAIVCDLTDTSGQVNAVAVSPGDILVVKFQRATDTSALDVKALMFGFEVTFS